MKKLVVVGFLFPLSIAIYPQDYLINFAGTGGSGSVESVKIENLTQGTYLTVDGTDMLNLKAALTGINIDYNTSEKSLNVYPNPVTEYANIEFIAPAPGIALIAIYDQVGKAIIQIRTILAKGTHTYQINGLSCGFYTVRVASATYSYAGKIISQQKGMAMAGVTCKSIAESIKNEEKLKSTNATIQMQYAAGDRLKFTGISGNYSTIVTDIPTESKTIAFDFIDCTDGDNNNYPVVKIGTQVWMAENLKTTKYNDGTAIPLVTDDTAWMGLSTPAYCWNNNDEAAYMDTYGALYNWYVVSTTINGGKNICPSGWHVPVDDEWTILTDYLGGDSVAGGKLKETGITHWISPNTGATNETGFTALPGGFRSYYTGGFNNDTYFGLWWSSSENAASDAWGRDSRYNGGGVLRSLYSKLNGLSVRCVRDD